MKHIFRMIMVAGIVAAGASTAMAAVEATGGTKTTIPGYTVHTFTNSGQFQVQSGGDIEVLVVAGGGGGGCIGGGGGAGGLIYSNVFPVVALSNYTVTVGGGGAGSTARGTKGGNGTNSVFGSIEATGGGGGGSYDTKNGANGGSGGGGSWGNGSTAGLGGTNTAGQGYVGGTGDTPTIYCACGGGGGASEAGKGGSGVNPPIGGAGGAGKSYDISGTTTYYAGGGGGGAGIKDGGTMAGAGGLGGLGGGGAGTNQSFHATAGTANTGGGGGGSRNDYNTGNGGNGGSGIVIVRYALSSGGSPLIETLDPTNITTSSAYMNGNLTTNGSSAATVRLYWGPSDGTNNPSAWATNITFAGTFSAASPLTTNITGLDPNTLYYYCYYATNGQGEIWASETKKFINGGVGIQKTSDASEIGLMPGTFTVYRASSATNVALTLTYARTGISATSDVDYTALSFTVTIPPGATNAPIAVTPLLNWAKLYDTTLELTLTSGVPICIFDAASNAMLTIANRPLPYNAPTNVWVAAAAGNASVAGNWSLNHVPTSSETVLLGPYSTQNMTWDSAATNTVAKWVQEAGYTGTVTIATTYSAPFTNLTVLGDVTLNGGTWTHLPNTTTESNRMCVTVGGNLFLTNATIHADGMGGTGGPGAGAGAAGGTYGGLGADYIQYGTTNYASSNTYGSIFAPTNLGSLGGRGRPGGAVKLTVAGTSTVYGVISANSGPQSQLDSNGSGGSVFLTTGWLIGSSNSAIWANGGPGTGDRAAGGGGRVAIILTGTGADFGNWRGTNSAYGWSWTTPISRSAAGTVYLAAGGIAAGGGTVVVDNNNYTTNTPYTALPAFTNSVEDLTKTPWIVQNSGKIKVVTNAKIWSLTMNTNSYLELAGYTLTLKALTITNRVFSAQTYVAADLGALVSDSSGSSGQVVVTGLMRGTLFTIY